MPGRIARTKTAERVSEILGSREGRRHLADHGWVQGMPIVMAVPTEPINDVMGLVSMHGRPALVAMLDNQLDVLKFLYISTPNSALRAVEDWDASSVTHPVPVFGPSSESITYAHRFGA